MTGNHNGWHRRQAPEVVATLVYTKECDVYSYGILVWEIFNNARQPFEEFSNKTVRRRLCEPTFRPYLSPDIPEEIRIIVTACWCPLPEQRPIMKDVAWILKKYIRHSQLWWTRPNLVQFQSKMDSRRLKSELRKKVHVGSCKGSKKRIRKEKNGCCHRIDAMRTQWSSRQK
ncbi:hypothetical protein GCK32_017665 [Trichostrongylus colubriformis]|uniref:Protein kinase domain-containing protein n=1 Tax=Trichostrongylus colubriformis TaxID=6319 RepID=A0AAN8FCN7_TRICO